MRILVDPPFGERTRAPFLLLVALTACGTMRMHVIIPALPATARALNMSISTTQLTITLYLIGLAFGQLFYGPVSDRFGRRPVLHAQSTKEPGEDMLLLPKTLPSICCLNMNILMA
jgi:MFS family permease